MVIGLENAGWDLVAARTVGLALGTSAEIGAVGGWVDGCRKG